MRSTLTVRFTVMSTVMATISTVTVTVTVSTVTITVTPHGVRVCEVLPGTEITIDQGSWGK